MRIIYRLSPFMQRLLACSLFIIPAGLVWLVVSPLWIDWKGVEIEILEQRLEQYSQQAAKLNALKYIDINLEGEETMQSNLLPRSRWQSASRHLEVLTQSNIEKTRGTIKSAQIIDPQGSQPMMARVKFVIETTPSGMVDLFERLSGHLPLILTHNLRILAADNDNGPNEDTIVVTFEVIGFFQGTNVPE